MDSSNSTLGPSRTGADAGHPESGWLEQFGRGELDEARTASIAEHIDNCEACRELLDGFFRDDSFLAELKRANHARGLVAPPPDGPGRPRSSSFWSSARSIVRRSASRHDEHPAGVRLTESFEGFLILEECGRGALASVYRARRRGFSRDVALKVFAADEVAFSSRRLEIARDLELGLRIKHPNILECFEVGRANGGVYVVSEWADAGSLRLRLDGTPWPVDQAANLIETLARAVQAAHERGMSHGHLTAENILLLSDRGAPASAFDRLAGPSLIPKLSDFGVTAAVKRPGRSTRKIHPERDASIVGESDDILALGGLFYELLTGVPPARADSGLLDSTNTTAVHPAGLIEGLPPALKPIVLRGIEDDPRERFPSVLALAEAIREVGPLVEEEGLKGRCERPRPRPEPRINLVSIACRFADFRILREIGRGGMGVVYEAEQISLGRRVALKVLPQTMKRDARSLERFRREARSAAQLHHTNIVPVFEVGEEGDSIFYAMQFIHGQGLNLVIEELKNLRRKPRGSGATTLSSPPTRIGSPDPADEEFELHPASISVPADQMARSLLTGGFVAAIAQGPTVAAGHSRGLEPDSTQGDPLSLAGDFFSHPKEAPPATSAVWPGGGPISMSGVSGRKQPFFQSVGEIGRQVAGGLAYAHARGIVHRDIKPANLLLDNAGVAWIADFGLAKSGDDGLTESGDILGTLRFMAPERFRGEGDGRADIYALGVTLYEMLTLRPAFESTDRLHLIEQVRLDEPPGPRTIDPSIPRDLETIVLKAMAKTVHARYATAHEMSEDLRRFLAGEPILARRTTPFERAWRWSRRNVLAASLAAAVMVTMVVGVITTSILANREHAMRIVADRARGEAERSLEELRVARSDESTYLRAIASERENLARDAANRDTEGSLDALYSQQAGLQRRLGRKLAAVETALARRALNVGLPDRLLQVTYDLTDCLPRGDAPEPDDLPASERERVADLAVETLAEAVLAGLHNEEYGLGYMLGNSAHLRPLHRHKGFLSILHAIEWRARRHGNGEVVVFGEHKQHIESCAITPDGKKALTLAADHTARLWDMTTSKPVFPPFVHPAELRGVSITSKGDLAAVGCGDGRIYLWSLIDGSLQKTLGGHVGSIHALNWTPDGKRLVSAGDDRTVRIWDRETGLEVLCLRGHQGSIIDMAMVPSGKFVITAGDDQTVRVWDIELGRPHLAPLTGHRGRVWSVAAYPDSRRVLTGDDDGYLIEWDIIEGRRLRTLTGHRATIRSIAISTDGRRALSAGPQNRLILWNLETGREVHRFPGVFGGGMSCVAISPDGKLAVTGSTDNIGRVWSLSEDGALARDLTGIGRWDEALVAFRRALRVPPEDLRLLDEGTTIAWGLGRWSEVVASHQILNRRFPSNTSVCLNDARTALMAGDREEYRRICKAARSPFVKMETLTSTQLNDLVLMAALAPDSGTDPTEPLRVLSDRAATEPDPAPLLHAIGLAEYRAGKYQRAISTLSSVNLDHPEWPCVSSVWPVLALCYHRIGNTAESQKWLNRSVEFRASKSPRFGRDPISTIPPWGGIWKWIDFEVMTIEAQRVIAPQTPALP